MSKTLLATRNVVQSRLRNASSTVWADAEVEVYIKEGYSDFVALTGALWKKNKPVSLDDVAGQALYDIPADCIEIERVTYLDRRIWPMSSRRLTELNDAYETEQ